MLRIQFPERYKDIEVVWLYRRAKEGVCLICGQQASYTIIDEEGYESNRCWDCFQQLTEFKKILLVEEGYWKNVLSVEFHGLRRNPEKPREGDLKTARIEQSSFLKCEICGCHFASKIDLESHVEAWHKPGGVYYGGRRQIGSMG
jgi:hypothetical protein